MPLLEDKDVKQITVSIPTNHLGIPEETMFTLPSKYRSELIAVLQSRKLQTEQARWQVLAALSIELNNGDTLGVALYMTNDRQVVFRRASSDEYFAGGDIDVIKNILTEGYESAKDQ